MRKSPKIMNIDEAITEIQRHHDRSRNKPLLVGIHSSGPDAGKTYFCKRACNVLHQDYKFDTYSMNNPEFDSVVEYHYHELEYLFYHIAINSETPEEADIEYWNRKIRPFTGRDVDVNVVIFNPNLTNPNLKYLVKVFDIVVCNPHSTKK